MRYGARNLYREVARYLPWIGKTETQLGGNGNGRSAPPVPNGAGSPSSKLEA
jgi:hypothetical protein